MRDCCRGWVRTEGCLICDVVQRPTTPWDIGLRTSRRAALPCLMPASASASQAGKSSTRHHRQFAPQQQVPFLGQRSQGAAVGLGNRVCDEQAQAETAVKGFGLRSLEHLAQK